MVQFQVTGQAPPDEGGLTAVEVRGDKVALATVEGQVYAFQDECTHMRCSLSGGDLEGRRLVCPCHMGTFDVTSGEAVAGPPRAALRTWPVRVVDGTVEIAT